MAIAAAFEMPVEVLRTDWAEFVRKAEGEQKALEAKYRMVPVARVETADQFDLLGSAFAFQMSVISGGEEARDVAAELQSFLLDLGDVYPELDPAQRRQSQKEALGYVRKLEALCCAVSVGVDVPKLTLRSTIGSKSAEPFPIGYAVVWLLPDVEPFVAIERGMNYHSQ